LKTLNAASREIAVKHAITNTEKLTRADYEKKIARGPEGPRPIVDLSRKLIANGVAQEKEVANPRALGMNFILPR